MRILLALLLVACKGESKPAPSSKPTTTPVPTPSAAPDAAPDFAAELEKLRAGEDVPALAAAIWRDGKLVDIGAVGTRKRGGTDKVTTKDLWHLGSNTKAMTATLIGIYVDRGTLGWNDTLATLFRGTKIDHGYMNVTLDQLLHHEGGMPGNPPVDVYKPLESSDGRMKFAQMILAKPPAQAPGTFEYSNTGYIIAGAALEKATGKRWEELMKTELFDKLGMSSCGFGAPVGDQPWGHKADGTPVEPGPEADNPPGLGPAGTVHCSLEDYGKFLALHTTGTPALVTPETLQHLHTGAAESKYAGGWLVAGNMLAHSGSNTAWYATAIVVPKKAAIVVITNSGKDAPERITLGLLMSRM